jgi:hypothetical protein
MIITLTLAPEHLRGACRSAIPTEDVFARTVRYALLAHERRLDPAHSPAPAPAFECALDYDAFLDIATLVLEGADFYVRVDAVAQAVGVMPADLIRAWLDHAFGELPGPHPPDRCEVGHPPLDIGGDENDPHIPF